MTTMDTLEKIVLLSVMIAGQQVIGTTGGCGRKEIETCFEKYNHPLPKDDQKKNYLLHYLPLPNQLHNIKVHCKLGVALSNCLLNLGGCDNFKKGNFKGVKDSVHFLCNESLPEFKKYQQCLTGEKGTHGKNKCHDDYVVHIRDIDAVNHKEEDEFCSVTRKFVNCNKDVVSKSCGDEAADWDGKFLMKVVDPIFPDFACNAASTWVIALSLTMIVVVCVVIIVVTLKCLDMKKKRNAAANQQFNNVLTS